KQIVGADDRRVAARVAGPDVALLENGDARDAVDLGEVVRSREAMAATADDDDVVARPGRGISPRGGPTAMAVECLAEEVEERVTHPWHRASQSTCDRKARVRSCL